MVFSKLKILSRKLKIFETKKSHHFLDLNEVILKIYTVWVFEIVFHKIIEENCKKFGVEISSTFYFCSFNIFTTEFTGLNSNARMRS